MAVLNDITMGQSSVVPLLFFEDCDNNICPKQLKALQHILTELSAIISSVHLEKRLHETSPDGYDLIIAIEKYHLNDLEQWILALPKAQQAAWDKVHNYIAVRRDNNDLFFNTTALWLEFDYDATQQQYSSPNICFCLTDQYLYQQHLSTNNNLDVILAGLDAIVPNLNDSQVNTLTRCITCLENKGTVIHVSVMQARQPVALKLFVELPQSQCIDFLIQAGWQGQTQPLSNMLSAMFPHSTGYEKLYIDLNIHDFSAPNASKLAFTYTQQHLHANSTLSPHREEVLRKLLKLQLCKPAYLKTASQWPGKSHYESKDAVIASNKWLDLKLVWHNESIAEAKAYFAFSENKLKGLQLLNYKLRSENAN